MDRFGEFCSCSLAAAAKLPSEMHFSKLTPTHLFLTDFDLLDLECLRAWLLGPYLDVEDLGARPAWFLGLYLDLEDLGALLELVSGLHLGFPIAWLEWFLALYLDMELEAGSVLKCEVTNLTHLEADLHVEFPFLAEPELLLAEEDLWMVPEGSLTLLEADLDLGPCPVDM